MVSKTYEFTSDDVPGWNNGKNRWVALEILFSVLGLGAAIYMEYHIKAINLTKKAGTPAPKPTGNQEEGARGEDYIDDSEDIESELPELPGLPSGTLPPASGTAKLAPYDIIHEFWLILFFHAVSLICGMRHSAQVLTVIFAYVHFLMFAAYVFFHVS